MERRMHFNRPSVIILVLYFIFGMAHNYIRSSEIYTSPIAWIVGMIGAGVLWLGMYAFIGWTIVRWKWSVKEWGFTLDRRVWINVAFIVGSSLIVILRQGPEFTPVISMEAPTMIMADIGAILEEMIFRIFLIFALIKWFGRGGWGIALAIAISAAIFTALHIPVAAPYLLTGMFISSLVFGCIAVWTRSVLFIAFYHSLSNTADTLGLLGGAVAIAIYFLVAGIGPAIERKIWE